MFVEAHRGASGTEPENTLRAFERAIELGVDWVECDVRLTRDGYLVLMHDESVDRTTNGTGKVSEMSLKELRALDAGKGEPVPVITELLELCKDRVFIFTELKLKEAVEPLLSEIKRIGMQDQVVVSSIPIEFIKEVRRLSETQRISLIVEKIDENLLRKAVELKAWGVAIDARTVTAETVERAHGAGLSVRSPVNPRYGGDIEYVRSEVKRLEKLGVDGVATDFPELVLRVLGRVK